MLALVMLLTAQAQVAEGVPVTLVIQDTAGTPITTAKVRHPEEKAPHRVNSADGSWTSDAVYLEDGTELVFEKKMNVPFEVRAPGYENRQVEILVQKKAKKNRFVVVLTPLEIDVGLQDDGGPSIGFKHDKPRD